MDKKMNVTVENGIKELVIREGVAAKVFDPVKATLTGTIESAQNYWELRKSFNIKEKCHVVYNTEKLYVNLRCNEDYPLGTEVNGSLLLNPELVSLGINGNSAYNLTSLRDKLKFMKTYFRDVDAYGTLMQNLAKFTATVNAQIQKEQSDRGNKKDNFEVTIDSNMDMSLVLSMPIYKGQPKSEFKVDICFDIREKNIEVWLESVELRDLQIQQGEKLIGDQVNYFDAEGIVTIEQ